MSAYFLRMTGEYGALNPLFDYSAWFKIQIVVYVTLSSWAPRCAQYPSNYTRVDKKPEAQGHHAQQDQDQEDECGVQQW